VRSRLLAASAIGTGPSRGRSVASASPHRSDRSGREANGAVPEDHLDAAVHRADCILRTGHLDHVSAGAKDHGVEAAAWPGAEAALEVSVQSRPAGVTVQQRGVGR
jgi:hypothetical protein